MNATINLENKHFPVLLNELISIISPLYGGTFIDCTFGQGGYSKKILEHKNNKVLAIDRDKDVYFFAKELEKNYKNRFFFQNIKFSEVNNLKFKTKDIKAVIFDLGYSFNQIKNSTKGLSFNSTGKLNMRMGINDFSANEVISNMSEVQDELVKITASGTISIPRQFRKYLEMQKGDYLKVGLEGDHLVVRKVIIS